MPAPDLSKYATQRRNVAANHAAQSAANTFGRTLGQQRGSRQLGDLRRNFGRQLPSFQASYGARNLAGGNYQSGVYKRALGEFTGDYNRQYGRQQQDMYDQMREFDMNQSVYDTERDRAYGDIDIAKAAEIASAAQQIQALRPYMGG